MAMIRKPIFWLLLILAATSGRAQAQPAGDTPTLPPVPVIGVEKELPQPPPTAPAPPSSRLLYLPEIQQSSKHSCQTCLGQIVHNMLTPFRTLIPRRDPSRSENGELIEMNQLPSVSAAEVAAARIKADELTVHRRQAAIRYLAKIDCQFNPEAEAALLAALRGDRNESVRFEAALALANSNCCTKKTVASLGLVVKGGDSDGNPAETSDRVKWAAAQALQCYAYYRNSPPDPLPLQLPIPTPVQKSTPSELQRTSYSPATAARKSATPMPFATLPPLTPIAPIPNYVPATTVLRPMDSSTTIRNDRPPVVEIGFIPQP